jgi:glycosyltransferase involved in cell wall biosynthesis
MLKNEAQNAPLMFRHAICVSAATRDGLIEAGIPISDVRIIYTGLEVERYLNRQQPQQDQDDRLLKLLYAGRLAADKGIETAIEAMEKLVHGQGKRNIRLSLVGSGSADYENHLRQLVGKAGLTDFVSFLGWVLPADMPRLLSKSDALVLPSIWPEPFSRSMLEGMISGLVVFATPTGGTPEIIVEGENGMLFMPNDSEGLARKIAQLAENPELHSQIGHAARQTVLERFTMSRMMDEIENYLQEIALTSLHEEATS